MQKHARCIAEALFQDEAGQHPSSGELDWLEREIGEFVHEAGAWTALLLGSCMWVVRLCVPLFARRLTSLQGLEVGARRAALEKLEESSLSLPFLAIKAALCLVYYEHPDVARRIGFDGRCLSGRERR